MGSPLKPPGMATHLPPNLYPKVCPKGLVNNFTLKFCNNALRNLREFKPIGLAKFVSHLRPSRSEVPPVTPILPPRMATSSLTTCEKVLLGPCLSSGRDVDDDARSTMFRSNCSLAPLRYSCCALLVSCSISAIALCRSFACLAPEPLGGYHPRLHS